MQQVYISMDIAPTGVNCHIMLLNSFDHPMTIAVSFINSPSKLRKIRRMLENNELNTLALWFKNEYNIIHNKITLSFGPEIRKWKKQINISKEKNQNESKNYYNRNKFNDQFFNKTNKRNDFKNTY